MKSKTNKNKTNKQKRQTDKIYATTAFKLLDFRQQRIEILRDWKQRGETNSYPNLLLWKFSGCYARERKIRQILQKFLIGKQSWESRKAKLAKVHKTKYWKGHIYAERESWRSTKNLPLSIKQTYWSANACEEIAWHEAKSHPKEANSLAVT